jgi:hypothetical protein
VCDWEKRGKGGRGGEGGSTVWLVFTSCGMSFTSRTLMSTSRPVTRAVATTHTTCTGRITI